jgi:hypothetical protein
MAWAVHRSINLNIKHSHCHLAFHQNMIFHCAVKIDWDKIHEEWQKFIAASNKKENQPRLVKQ